MRWDSIFRRYKKIYVYGCGNLGRNTYNKLYMVFQDVISGIVVSKHNMRSRNMVSLGRKIFQLDEIDDYENVLFIVAVNPISHEKIKQNLLKKNVSAKQILIYNKNIDDWINLKLHTMNNFPKLETRLLAVSVGQACNYRCRDCMNFAPFAHKENLRYNIDHIIKDIDKILSFFQIIDTFHIQGGEPFLYSDLEQLIKYIGEHYMSVIQNVQIATNGSIIPKEEVLQSIKKYGFIVRISDYRHESKINTLIDKLNEYGIVYKKYDFADGSGEWKKGGDMDYCIPTDENLDKKVFTCRWNTCFTIENTYVGRCARSIPARTLQNIVLKHDDYISLLDSSNLTFEKISQYFMFVKPMDCCRHCKGTSGESVEPAIQL